MKQILRIVSIPVTLGGLLALVGVSIGWNLITLFIFWFLMIPILALQMPRLLSGRGNQWLESILGLVIFYAAVVFMIYEHYQTDYFQVMMISFFANLIMIIVKSRRRLTHSAHPEI